MSFYVRYCQSCLYSLCSSTQIDSFPSSHSTMQYWPAVSHCLLTSCVYVTHVKNINICLRVNLVCIWEKLIFCLLPFPSSLPTSFRTLPLPMLSSVWSTFLSLTVFACICVCLCVCTHMHACVCLCMLKSRVDVWKKPAVFVFLSLTDSN